MIDRNMLYQSSSNELTQARTCQSQISQKEFEMRLIDINNQYSYNNHFSNNLQKQNLELEIKSLKNYRNNHICNAIDYALQLAEKEIYDNIVYSMASIAINSINSYLMNYNSEMIFLPQYLRERLANIYTNLQSRAPINTTLLLEIIKLRTWCV